MGAKNTNGLLAVSCLLVRTGFFPRINMHFFATVSFHLGKGFLYWGRRISEGGGGSQRGRRLTAPWLLFE